MPKKIDPELKARAVRMVTEHEQEYASLTAASAAVARKLGVGVRACAGGCCRPRSTPGSGRGRPAPSWPRSRRSRPRSADWSRTCLLYTSDAADDLTRVDLGGRRIIKKKK